MENKEQYREQLKEIFKRLGYSNEEIDHIVGFLISSKDISINYIKDIVLTL